MSAIFRSVVWCGATISSLLHEASIIRLSRVCRKVDNSRSDCEKRAKHAYVEYLREHGVSDKISHASTNFVLKTIVAGVREVKALSSLRLFVCFHLTRKHIQQSHTDTLPRPIRNEGTTKAMQLD